MSLFKSAVLKSSFFILLLAITSHLNGVEGYAPSSRQRSRFFELFIAHDIAQKAADLLGGEALFKW